MVLSNGRQDLTSGYNFYLHEGRLGLIMYAEEKERYRPETERVTVAEGRWAHVAVTYEAALRQAQGRPEHRRGATSGG